MKSGPSRFPRRILRGLRARDTRLRLPTSKLRSRHAIRNPIGSPTLAELVARHGKRTLMLVDDSTRSTPQKLILPILLDELNAAGVPDSEISAMIALGTHRRMEHREIADARRPGRAASHSASPTSRTIPRTLSISA